MLIGRDELIKKVLYYAGNNQSLFIKASTGSGKTVLLKELNKLIKNSVYSVVSTKKEILTSIALKLGLPVKGKRVFELIDEITFELEITNLVLLLDDVHELTNSIKKVMIKMMNKGLVVICAGERNALDLAEASMPNLSNREIEELIKARIKEPDQAVIKLIQNNCSTPQEIVNAIRKKGSKELKSVEAKKSFINSLNLKKKELMPVWVMGVAVTLMLSLRYYFYMIREFETGYTVAFAAYILRAITAVRKR